jgi:hypothetical protein
MKSRFRDNATCTCCFWYYEVSSACSDTWVTYVGKVGWPTVIVHQEVPAFFAHSRDEQIRLFTIVVGNGPEDCELLVVHSQARRVCQHLDVILNGIVSICDQGLELGAPPQVARI